MAGKAILWDFDGTLAYRDGLWGGCLTQVLQQNEPDLGITRDDVRPFLEDGFPWHRPEVPHPELNDPEAWWSSLEQVLARAAVGVGVTEDRAKVSARETHLRYIDCTGFRVFEDVIPVLTELKADGWRHVILSNHMPELRDIVAGLELGALIDEVLCSAVTGYEKPHPKAFELGRAAAGDVSDLWMVGDNVEVDVRGAEAVGIPAILVRSRADGVERRADDLYGVADFLH